MGCGGGAVADDGGGDLGAGEEPGEGDFAGLEAVFVAEVFVGLDLGADGGVREAGGGAADGGAGAGAVAFLAPGAVEEALGWRGDQGTTQRPQAWPAGRTSVSALRSARV